MLSSAALESVVRASTQLQSLVVFQVGGQDSVSDGVLCALGTCCPSLTALNVSYAKHDPRHGLMQLAKGCRKLRTLDLLGCSDIDDSVLKALAIHCPRLVSMDILYCQAVSDRGLASLAAYCHNLRILDATYCGSLTNRGVAHMMNHCPSSRTVIVSACARISEEVFGFIADEANHKKLEC